MYLLDRLSIIFREKYGKFLEELEASLFVVIEDVILAQNIPLDSPIDYNSSQYSDTCRIILTAIGEGLKKLKFPLPIIESYLIRYYPTFSRQLSYIEWIGKEFQPKVQKILFYEILKYLSNYPSNIKNLVSLGVLNATQLGRLDQIKAECKEYSTYFQWYFKIADTFLNKILQKELDFSDLLSFSDTERSVQSVYILYRILELLELENHLNLVPIIEFLQKNIPKWGIQNLNISEKYPMTIFAGLYLINKAQIPFNTDEVNENIKKILVSLVNNFSAPIFEDTYLVYHTVRSCLLLGLKLSEKLITGLTRLDPQIVNSRYLKNLSTARLGTIYQCYRILNVLDKMPGQIRTDIQTILQGRIKDKLVFDYDIDFLPMSEALLGSMFVSEAENTYDMFDLKEFFAFIARTINENLYILDFSLTGQLSDIYYGLKVIEHFNNWPLAAGDQMFRKVLLGITATGSTTMRINSQPTSTVGASNIQSSSTNPSFSQDDLFSKSSTQIAAGLGSVSINTPVKETFDPFQDSTQLKPKPQYDFKPPSISKFSPQQSAFSPAKRPQDSLPEVENKPKIIIESPSPAQVSNPIVSVSSAPAAVDQKNQMPSFLWDFFGHFPSLNSDIIDEMQLNMAGIGSLKQTTYSSLSNLHRWIICLRSLNLEIPIAAEEVFRRTAPFRKENGFGIEGSLIPDPQNTFFGLSIYSEMGLLERLNLYAIQEYLQKEIDHFDTNFVLTNDYLFMALRLLEKQGIQIGNFSSLIQTVSKWNAFKITEGYETTTDFLHCINLLRAINPAGDYSQYIELYFNEIKGKIMENGSIHNRVTDTAKALLSLNELGQLNSFEAKSMIRFLQYDPKLFGEVVAKEPIGWDTEGIGYELELGIAYWTLLALTVIYPTQPPVVKAIVCPGCRRYFNQKPKFCNICGHRF
jgi:hypothetical protein